MSKTTGARYIAETLKGYGVTHVFYMEIILPNSVSTAQFDSAGTGLGQGGTAWTDRLYAQGSGSSTGSSGGDDGMVTKFNFVPAPGAAGLLAAAGLVGTRRRR